MASVLILKFCDNSGDLAASKHVLCNIHKSQIWRVKNVENFFLVCRDHDLLS